MLIRPLAAGDASELLRIHRTPEVARWWGEPEDGFPLADDPDATRQTIVIDGRIAGMIEFGEELTPRYRHASIDLFLDPEFTVAVMAPRRSGASRASCLNGAAITA